ncbi:MAG: hypothetical protein RQ736_06775 [Thiogranum sp.]|nr:hypothetical protein [Thiogranum sp.]
MTGSRMDLFALLGVLELALVLVMVALVFIIRSKKLAAQVQSLQRELKNAVVVAERIGFDHYLRDEILRNQGLIEQAAQEHEKHPDAVRMLTLRTQFLELELQARELEKNPVQFQKRIAAGIQELIASLLPQAKSADAEPESAKPARQLHDTHNEELDHLRQVINNQQDSMKLLRTRLKDSSDEIPDLDSILKKLDEFEKQSRELHHCLETLEAENERLKAEKKGGSGTIVRSADTAQLSGLKNMVDKQQTTIASLHTLIRELAPNATKAHELEEALASIQHTNDELTGCVAVLEDENSMLRDELAEIQAHLEKQDAGRAEAPEGEADDNSAGELEIRLQELEALLEFKDAAIEELERQYNRLQGRYLAETGKTSID